MIELGTSSSPTAYYCQVYNYYSDEGNPTSCVTPTQGVKNNGNVMGYWYQDNVQPWSHTATYTYDNVNRILTAVGTPFGSGTASYNLNFNNYDAYGNMSCVQNANTNGPCPQWAYNTSTNHIKTAGCTYDAAGNMTADCSSTDNHTYQWDGEGRVASVDNGSTWTFTYDALGDRVQMTGPSGPQYLAYDVAGNWIMVFGGYGNYDAVRWGRRMFAVYLPTGTDFNHVNNIASTMMYTNQAGAVVEDMLFYPWGQVWESWGTGGYNYAGIPYRDLSTTTDLSAFRNLSPGLGRWLSPDPLGEDAANPSDPQTWNMYAYARNNPTTLRDPSGLWGWDPSAGGNYTDEELSEMANDEDNEYHKWAQQALDYRQEFRDALYNLSESAGYLAGVQGALMAYGTENDSNGVFVGFSKNLGYGATTELQDSDSINVVFGSSMKGNFLTATVAHEGVHVDQAQTWMFFGEGSLFDLNHYAREGGAWEVEGQVAQALGMKNLRPHGAGQEYDVWNKGWSSGSIAAQRDAAVLRILSDLYHVKPSDTDTFSNEPHLGIP